MASLTQSGSDGQGPLGQASNRRSRMLFKVDARSQHSPPPESCDTAVREHGSGAGMGFLMPGESHIYDLDQSLGIRRIPAAPAET